MRTKTIPSTRIDDLSISLKVGDTPWLFPFDAPSKKSVWQHIGDMTFLNLLALKKMAIYRVSQLSGIPKITLTDLGLGKTLLGISKVLKAASKDDWN